MSSIRTPTPLVQQDPTFQPAKGGSVSTGDDTAPPTVARNDRVHATRHVGTDLRRRRREMPAAAQSRGGVQRNDRRVAPVGERLYRVEPLPR